MRKNRSKFMKRCTVAVVSVATVAPTAAPAIPAFADELETSEAGSAEGETETTAEAESESSAESTEATESETETSESSDTETSESDESADSSVEETTTGASDESTGSSAEGDGETGEKETVPETSATDETTSNDLLDGDLTDDATSTTGKEEKETISDETLADITLGIVAFKEYPEFGSEEFVLWLADASDEEVEAWYQAARAELKPQLASPSDAEIEKEVLDFGTDEFWTWIYEDAAKLEDGEWLYDMDAILDWITDAGYDDAYAFLDEFFIQGTAHAPEEKKELPAFGTEAFNQWIIEAIEDPETLRSWYDAQFVGVEGATEEELAQYALEYDSDEFWTWFMENAVIMGDDGISYTYRYDVIAEWLSHVPYDTAAAFLDFYAHNLSASTFAMAGALWPQNYGANGDVYSSEGRGTEDSPYIINSVEDLRQFAVSIAQGIGNTSDTYYKIESGSYDLNGTWLPVGGALNPGGNPTAFMGHLAADDVVIENFGLKSNNAIGVDATLVTKVSQQSHYGFFAKLGPGATVTGLTIETNNNEVSVNSGYTAILVAEAIDATIKECRVSGYVKSTHGYIGGIVGYARGSSTGNDDRTCIIENCQADEIAVWTSERAPSGFCDGHSAVGGIAGFASNTSIIDTTVDTNAGSGNHIYGNWAYVGGIVGAIDHSDVINSYVENGQIGSNESYSVGGLVGGYGGGMVRVGRFSGDIISPSSGYNYSACFMGSSVNGASFTYGERGDVAYLFADTKSKADKGIFGGKPAGVGGTFGTDAHIGYWHAADKGYTLISGSVDHDSSGDDYFYEELERGILATTLAAGGSSAIAPNLETLDHYTCNTSGNPIRGYLLTVANPVVNSTVASNVTAYVLGNNYRKPCTSENQVAFAEGDVVYLKFEDQKDQDAYFQLDTSKADNPWYTYRAEDPFYVFEEMTSQAGVSKQGGYHFTMPASDTTVGAEYKAVSQSVTINPNRVVFEITQERTGTRERPALRWTVTAYDADPALSSSAKVIKDGNGVLWQDIEIAEQSADGMLTINDEAKFWMSSKVNGVDNQGFNLDWAYSNATTIADKVGNGIVHNLTPGFGNASAPTAYFMMNLTDPATSAIAKKAEELATKQANEGYKNSITTVEPYWYHSVITATARVGESVDPVNPPVGYMDATFKFNIVDNTQVAVNGVALNRNKITYNVVRTLTGDRSNPVTRYSINGESGSTIDSVAELIASFNPDYFSKNQVNWYITEDGLSSLKDAEGNILTGNAFEEAFAAIRHNAVEGDMESKDNGTFSLGLGGTDYKKTYVDLKGVTAYAPNGNVTISNWVMDEDKLYTSLMKKNPGNEKTYERLVKVTAKDNSNHSVTDTCLVTVNFKTEDKTEIMPTEVKINDPSHAKSYMINYSFAGDTNSEITSRVISTDDGRTILTDGMGQDFSATIKSNGVEYDSSNSEYQPYDNGIVWSIGNPNASEGDTLDVTDVLSIDKDTGVITVRGYSDATDETDLGFSPWVQDLIASKKLNGTTVPVRIYATSKKDSNVYDYVDINVTFKAKAASSEEAEYMFDIAKTQKVARDIAGTSIQAANVWTGYEDKNVAMTLTGVNAAPVLVIKDEDGNEVYNTNMQGITSSNIVYLTDVQYDNGSKKTTAKLKINRNATWFKDVENARSNNNKGQKTFTIIPKTANGIEMNVKVPITVDFRYEGLDMTASTVTDLPNGYEPTPDHYTADTPQETYDTDKATVVDRDINMGVVVTQGSATSDVEATKKWSYGIVKLDNTYYGSNGVMSGAGNYSLVGDLAKYAKIDEKGYLVPIKGEWEKLIEAGQNTGTVTGVVTCKNENGGVSVEDNYKVNINFRYDSAYIDQHEKTFDVVYTDASFTNDKKGVWTGEDPFQIKAHFTGENGTEVAADFEFDSNLLDVDKDGNVTLNRSWMQEIVDNAADFDSDVFSGTKTTTITAKGPNGTSDTCVVTINFRYDRARLNSNKETYTIVRSQKSRTNDPAHTWSELKDGKLVPIESRQLTASLNLADGVQTHPYWSTDNAEVVTVNDAGVITPAVDQAWQNEVIENGLYRDVRTAAVNVFNREQTVKDSCNVEVNYVYEEVALRENNATLKVKLRATGLKDDATYVVEGYELDNPAVLHSYDPNETKVSYNVTDGSDFIAVDENGKISLKLPTGNDGNMMQGQDFKTHASKFIQDAMTHPYGSAEGGYTSVGNAVVTASTMDGRLTDQCNLRVEFIYEDLNVTESEQTLNVKIRALNKTDRVYDITGFTGKIDYEINSTDPENTVTFSSADPDIIVNADGTYSLRIPDRDTTNWTGDKFHQDANFTQLLKDAFANPVDGSGMHSASKDVVVTAKTAYGDMQDNVTIHINVDYEEVSIEQGTMDLGVKVTKTEKANADGTGKDTYYEFTGDLNNKNVVANINSSDLDNTRITYSSSDPDVVTVDEITGKLTFVTPRNDQMREDAFMQNASEFIKQTIQTPYGPQDPQIGYKDVTITATDKNGNKAYCIVRVALTYENLETNNESVTMNLTLRATDTHNNKFKLIGDPVSVAAVLNSPNITDITYTSANGDVIQVDENGVASMVLPAEITEDGIFDANTANLVLRDMLTHPYDPSAETPYVRTYETAVTASAISDLGNSIEDTTKVIVNLKYEKFDIEDAEQTLNVKIRATNLAQKRYDITGYTGKADFGIFTANSQNDTATFVSSDSDIIVNADGTYSLNIPDKSSTNWEGADFENQLFANEFIKSAIDNPATVENPISATKYVTLTGTSKYDDMQDQVKVRVNLIYEEVALDKNEINMDVKLKATGYAEIPTYEFTGTTASLQSFISSANLDIKNVTFKSSNEEILKVDKDGNVNFVTPYYFDHKSFMEQASQFIKDAMKRPYMDKDPYVHKETVTISVYSEGNVVMADECKVNVNLIYENLTVQNKDVTMNLKLRAKNLFRNEYEVIGEPVSVAADVNSPVYDKAVYTSSDNKLLKVDENGMASIVLPASMTGSTFLNGANAFLKDALLHPYSTQNPYVCTTTAVVTAATEDGTMKDTTTVTIKLIFENADITDSSKTMDVTITATGRRSNPTYTVTGNSATLKTAFNSTNTDEHGPNYTSADASILAVDQNGNLAAVIPGFVNATDFANKANAFVKEALEHPYTNASPYVATRTIMIKSTDDECDLSDECPVKINLKFVDNTTSSSGGGGGGSSSGGSGGGGGGSSTGVRPSGSITKTSTGVPDYVVKGGTWTQNADGKWLYTNNRTYTDEWAAVLNPYADTTKGQQEYDWFHFDENSFMSVGWYTDEKGDTYFLHDVSDNTLGHMYTGWHWIDDNKDGTYEYYYFETESNGTRGKLYKNTNVGGYMVNSKGQWVNSNGTAVTKTAAEVNAAQAAKPADTPAYAITGGTWSKNTNGRWVFRTAERAYANEWAAVVNPYADTSKGQSSFDWFRFDKDGSMMTGWYTDEKGDTFFLNNVSDNTLGRMFTGWNWIDDNGDGIYECYYFEPQSNGTRGKLYKNATIDGYRVNDKGQWVNSSGTVVRKNAAELGK